MKHPLLLFSTAVVLSVAIASPLKSAEDTEKLNLLFIISDDLRTELGCYASPLARTPNLDALAAAGVRFDRAYCQFPLCNPSRVSMLTGRDPSTTGVLGNRTSFRQLHPDFVTLPQYFKANGYATLRSGKVFHGRYPDPLSWTEVAGRRGNPRTGRAPGRPIGIPASFRQTEPQRRPRSERARRSDRWLVLEGNGESSGDFRRADRAIELLRKYKDEPFFLVCGFSKPHSPLEAPKRFYDLYDVDKISLPPDFAPSPKVPPGFPERSVRPRNADLFIGRDATPEEARQMIRAYLATVSWLDWNVGRVMAELDRLGLREKTIIVFWSDHGYQLGEKGKWSKAGSLWEQGARVPLIIVSPKAKANGQATQRVVQSIDLYPTLVELCGLQQPEGLEGRSLAPILEDPKAPWDHPAYTVWSENGRTLTGIVVRTERWRYAEFDRGGAMLIDPVADPHEMKNLADDPKYASVRTKLSALVKAYAAQYPSAKPNGE